MDLFNVSDEVYLQLIYLFNVNFKKVESKRRGRFYYTTMVKESITLTTASIERIFHLNHDPSKFPPLMSACKARKLFLKKYAHPSKIKKSNQFWTALCSNSRILYIIVRTIYPRWLLY